MNTAVQRWQEWLLSRRGLFLGLAWGTGEGSFFFVVPDVLITLAALFSVRHSLKIIGAVLVGSLVAGALLFEMSRRVYDSARGAVSAVPFVRERMFEATERDFASAGVWALCKGPLSGIPYKVYAVQAPKHTSLVAFLAVSIPARLERLLLSWALFAAVGAIARAKLATHPHVAIGGHALYWIGIYAYYWSVI